MASLHSTHQVPIRKTALGMTLEIDVLWKRPTKKKNERKEREREREENRSTMAKTNDVVGWSVRNRSLELRSCHHLKVTVRPSRTDNSVTQLVAK